MTKSRWWLSSAVSFSLLVVCVARFSSTSSARDSNNAKKRSFMVGNRFAACVRITVGQQFSAFLLLQYEISRETEASINGLDGG